jgi:hypothetical protein
MQVQKLPQQLAASPQLVDLEKAAKLLTDINQHHIHLKHCKTEE